MGNTLSQVPWLSQCNNLLISVFFFFRFYVCVEILAFYPIMFYFQVFSFLRSGEKVDCKKWYEGKKKFHKNRKFGSSICISLML